MSIRRSFNRLALAASLPLALVVAAFGQGALAEPALTFRDVHVDVQPLRANAGDPTATWVEHDLTGQLAQALAGRMSRGGAPLTVRIDYLTLGPQTGEMLHAGASLDNIQGVAVIGGKEMPIRATSSYYSTPVDQTMIERVKSRARVAAHPGADVLDRARRLLLRAGIWVEPPVIASEAKQSTDRRASIVVGLLRWRAAGAGLSTTGYPC